MWLYTEQNKLAVFCENQFLIKENYSSNATENPTFANSKNLKEDTFYYVTLTYSKETVTLYVDAKEYAVYHNVKPFSGKERLVLIGIANDTKTGGKFQYEGVLDELKIFNKRLTETKISTLYNSYKRQ